MVGGWFGILFWAVGAFSLFAAATGIVDYTSRLAADILKTTYLRSARVTESQLYFWLVWGLVGLGLPGPPGGPRPAAGPAGHLGLRRRAP